MCISCIVYSHTHLARQDGQVVPLRHFPVKRPQNCDGSILGVDVVKPLRVRVLIYRVSVERCEKEEALFLPSTLSSRKSKF